MNRDSCVATHRLGHDETSWQRSLSEVTTSQLPVPPSNPVTPLTLSRYFSANYAIVIALLAVYSLITNPLLLISLGFLIGGFLGISRFGELHIARWLSFLSPGFSTYPPTHTQSRNPLRSLAR